MTAEPTPGLYRLIAWASPSFPVGAFSYSHGLEAAAAAGAVHDRTTLAGWIAAILAHGCGRIDADILCTAHRAAATGDMRTLTDVNRRGAAYRATAELARESAQQGCAFLAACRAAWPDPLLAMWETGEEVCYSAAFGAAAGRAGITLADALLGYLAAFASNLVSAGLRLGLIGQTDGQRILAGLEPLVAAAAAAAMSREAADFGAAACALDLASMAHETQYSRLFRS